MAEWSKALVLGTSPKGRGFESHSCQSEFWLWQALPGALSWHMGLGQPSREGGGMQSKVAGRAWGELDGRKQKLTFAAR